ncbi:trimeric intracellular cation channel family protein, partial [Xanthomonas sp. Kuri4-3]
MATFLLLLDLVGTFVFALSGATVAVRHRLDLFGVLVLACAAAVSGGIIRDVLIGATPP